MIKYFCDLCGEELKGDVPRPNFVAVYEVSVHSNIDGDDYDYAKCICRDCANILMDTIRKLRRDK